MEKIDAERRRQIRKESKKILAQRSQKFMKLYNEANPIKVPDPRWSEMYKENSIKEKIFRTNRVTIYKKEMIGVDFLLIPTTMNLSGEYIPVSGYYIHCLICGNLVPMDPEKLLICDCGGVIINPAQKRVVFNKEKAEVVKLMAKFSMKPNLFKRCFGIIKKLFV